MTEELILGQLDVAQQRREIIPALLRNAPFAEDELHIPLQLQFNERMPIVISFYEYYRFLDRLVSLVLNENIAPVVLVRVKMPATIPLPQSLLDSRVGLFHELDVESAQLRALGKEHLCIDANFKLYSWSAGDNRFSIRWVSPAGRRLEGSAVGKVRSVVEMLPATIECAGLQRESE